MNVDPEDEELLRRLRRLPDQLDAGAALWAKAERVIRKPVAEWPEFEPVWDCDDASFHLSLDGTSPEAFASSYPDGVCCCDVDLSDLDSQLCGGSLRSAAEVWGIADTKVAEAICFWTEGGKMTPPMILLITAEGKPQLYVKGGNNRLAIVRAKGVVRLKVLIRRNELAAVSNMLRSLREETPSAKRDAGALT